MPTISIIIPTWNTAEITFKNVSKLNQFLPNNFAQIIVVDNGSTDNTAKLLSKLSFITYIKNDDNLGFSKANNIGAKVATGEYLLFLNSDMEIIDDSIKNMVEYCQLHPNVGIIGPKLLNPDMSPQGSVFPPQTPINAFKEFWLNIPSYSKYTPNTDIPVVVWAISGGAILISRNIFNNINCWNEKYFMYFEDLDLCQKVRKLSLSIVYFPTSKIIHRHGSSGKNVTDAANQWRRLIPGSKKFHGLFNYYLIFMIMWLSQKLHFHK